MMKTSPMPNETVTDAERIRIAASIMDGLVKYAVDTEPTDYSGAIERLSDPRTIRLLHAAMGLATEAGEFVDALKKHIFYGKVLDGVNLMEELGDVSWYERIALDAIETGFLSMVLRNVAKLKARFPEKFTEAAAINRNLDIERAILETKESHT